MKRNQVRIIGGVGADQREKHFWIAKARDNESWFAGVSIVRAGHILAETALAYRASGESNGRIYFTAKIKARGLSNPHPKSPNMPQKQ
jgi:hypothetical protein